jgi:hypothetical protein
VGLSPERVGRNDATFRAANERIFDSAREHKVTDAIPFLCECADPLCAAIIRLDAGEYERIRNSGRFFNAPGHAMPFLNALQIEERHGAYEVVVTYGAAAGPAADPDLHAGA